MQPDVWLQIIAKNFMNVLMRVVRNCLSDQELSTLFIIRIIIHNKSFFFFFKQFKCNHSLV